MKKNKNMFESTQEEAKKIVKLIKSEETYQKGVEELYYFLKENNTFYHALCTIRSPLTYSFFNEYQLEDIESDVFMYLINKRFSFFDEDMENANFFSYYIHIVNRMINKEFLKIAGIKNKNDFMRRQKIKAISQEYNIPMKEDYAYIFEEIINTKDTNVKNKSVNATIDTCISALRIEDVNTFFESRIDNLKDKGFKEDFIYEENNYCKCI